VRLRVVLAAAVVALALPAAASAHAYLTKTFPSASGVLDKAPPDVELTFDEAVEPRFAIVSVTDAGAHSETDGTVHRSPANPDTLIVPLKHVAEGWYLVYWRAISVDGHPVQGAFTFAVGPNPGPAPQFVIPHIAQTATSTPLVFARWAMFLTVMVSIGLLSLRLWLARPVVRRVEGASLRPLTIAFVVASLLGLLAIPVYLELATAGFSLRSFWDFGVLVPLWRTSAFGRGYVDLEICFALFCAAAWVALWVDKPDRESRSVAELLAGIGALGAAAAVLIVPGASGHAAQTAPRGIALGLDWLHLLSGSIWIGGLAGLLVLWRTAPAAQKVPALSVAVPRFSNAAFWSVLLLLGSGVGATILHMPLLQALWQTSYGQVILVKSGLLIAAASLGALNLLRTKRRLAVAETAPRAARQLAWAVRGEALIVVGAIFAAALLSSLAPPPPALASESKALAQVGPGRVASTVRQAGYTLKVLVSPNKAAAPNQFALDLTKAGKPVTGAQITLTFEMLDMQMGNQEYSLKETAPGIYSRPAPALVMVGHWALSFSITPKGRPTFTAVVVDRTSG
jgi:copper transport protein